MEEQVLVAQLGPGPVVVQVAPAPRRYDAAVAGMAGLVAGILIGRRSAEIGVRA